MADAKHLPTAEVWKDIPEFPRYQVSNFGRVKSIDWHIKRKDGNDHFRKGTMLKQALDTAGYNQVHLVQNDGVRILLVHRVVALVFLDNPDNKAQVNHKNGIKTDNSLDNLEWVTKDENTQHAVKTGLIKRGAQLNYSRLVINLENGIFYDSITDAANAHGIKGRTLHHWLYGDRKNKSALSLA